MDPRHRPYYWIEEGENHWEFQDHSDYQAVSDGYVSITPLQPDMTAHEAFEYLERLSLIARRQPPARRGAGLAALVAFFVVLSLVLGLGDVLVALHDLGRRRAPC